MNQDFVSLKLIIQLYHPVELRLVTTLYLIKNFQVHQTLCSFHKISQVAHLCIFTYIIINDTFLFFVSFLTIFFLTLHKIVKILLLSFYLFLQYFCILSYICIPPIRYIPKFTCINYTIEDVLCFFDLIINCIILNIQKYTNKVNYSKILL